MSLETIIKTYGWHDYMEQSTGMIYELSKAKDIGDGLFSVPVKESDGEFVGYAIVEKEEGMEVQQ